MAFLSGVPAHNNDSHHSSASTLGRSDVSPHRNRCKGLESGVRSGADDDEYDVALNCRLYCYIDAT